MSYISVFHLILDFHNRIEKYRTCCFQCIGIAYLFEKSAGYGSGRWFPLASQNLSHVTKTCFMAHLIAACEVEHSALLMLSCRLP